MTVYIVTEVSVFKYEYEVMCKPAGHQKTKITQGGVSPEVHFMLPLENTVDLENLVCTQTYTGKYKRIQ